jgi:hypothetical protein
MVSTSQSVEDLPNQGMPYWQARMIEVLGRITLHPKAFHDGSRPKIGHGREGNNLPQGKLAEAVINCKPGGLCSITVPPMLKGQPPADLHARSKVRTEPHYRQAAEAGERSSTPHVDYPQPEAVHPEMPLNPICERIALTAVERRTEELHDARIGIHQRKRIAIIGTPRTQPNTTASKFNSGARGERTLACSGGCRTSYCALANVGDRTHEPPSDFVHPEPRR